MQMLLQGLTSLIIFTTRAELAFGFAGLSPGSDRPRQPEPGVGRTRVPLAQPLAGHARHQTPVASGQVPEGKTSLAFQGQQPF